MTVQKKFLKFVVPGFSGLCVFSIIAVVTFLILVLLINGVPHLSWKFLTSAPEQGMTAGGIFPAIIGTFLLVLIMSIVGVPIGTITALYLSEYLYQGSNVVKIIRFAVNTLAGIPSIVYGLFGLGFFVRFLAA